MEFAGNKSPITPEAVFIIGTYDENGVQNAMNVYRVVGEVVGNAFKDGLKLK